MKQVLLVAAPTIAVFAVDSAVSAICQETLCSREIFDAQEKYLKKGTLKNVGQIVDAEVGNTVIPASQDQASIPEVIFMPLKARVATTTALGAAATHAKLLVEQEERELEHLMADILEMQMKKFQDKIKHFKSLSP